MRNLLNRANHPAHWYSLAVTRSGTTLKPAMTSARTWSSSLACRLYGGAHDGIEPWDSYNKPIEQAVTLPASWYTSSKVHALEMKHVLGNSWQMVGHSGQVASPGDFFTGSLGPYRYVVVKGQDGAVRAFHNVCRHHAAAVASGCGNQEMFTCPYHGWTYDLQGRLRKATRLKGIEGFKASEYGLHPIACDTWGPWVFIHMNGGAAARTSAGPPVPVAEWLATGGARMEVLGFKDPLLHLCRREYIINCNWKVFCDNYLDGGYHVQYAHKDLASNLNLDDYRIELHVVLSLQTCSAAEQASAAAAAAADAVEASSTGRQTVLAAAAAAAALEADAKAAKIQQAITPGISSSSSSSGSSSSTMSSSSSGGLQRVSGGRDAAYAFVYPNFMANRYGPWLDTNAVLPCDAHHTNRCKVIFDYWLQPDALDMAVAEHHEKANRSRSSSDSHSSLLDLSSYEVSASRSSGSSRSISDMSSKGEGGSPEDQRREGGLAAAAMYTSFVQESLASSHQVQVEDIALCEAVQQGLEEPSYGVGRYAPGPERPMFLFHQQLYAAVQEGLQKDLS